MTAAPDSLVLVSAPWFPPSPTPPGFFFKGSGGMSSKFHPHSCKQPRSTSTSLSKENREEKVLLEQKQTYRWRRIHSSELVDPMRDHTHILQDLPEVLQDLLLRQLLSQNHLRWILGPGILEAITLPRLQRLNLAMEVASNDAKPNQTLLLQNLNPFKEWLDLLKVFN
jgi:hypothetical protein